MPIDMCYDTSIGLFAPALICSTVVYIMVTRVCIVLHIIIMRVISSWAWLHKGAPFFKRPPENIISVTRHCMQYNLPQTVQTLDLPRALGDSVGGQRIYRVIAAVNLEGTATCKGKKLGTVVCVRMGCVPSAEERAANERSKAIDELLQTESAQKNNEVKLLLLGEWAYLFLLHWSSFNGDPRRW